jgi:hypothetical protein
VVASRVDPPGTLAGARDVLAPIGGGDAAAVEVFTQAQRALAEVRRVKALGRSRQRRRSLARCCRDRAPAPRRRRPTSALRSTLELSFGDIDETIVEFAAEPGPEPRA